jgi:hypothetical protein
MKTTTIFVATRDEASRLIFKEKTRDTAEDRQDKVVADLRNARPHRFPMVFCSQCGCGFGSGNLGFSHCENHKGMPILED